MAQPRTVRSDKAGSTTIALRVSAEDRRRVERIAKRRGVTLSELLREAVQELEKPA